VSDTGIVIPEEKMELALSPFARYDSKLSRKFERHGLGLPLTKRLVELHGGTMKNRGAKWRKAPPCRCCCPRPAWSPIRC